MADDSVKPGVVRDHMEFYFSCSDCIVKAEPQGESAQHDEAQPDLWGMVNAVSAGKDHALTRGDLLNFAPT